MAETLIFNDLELIEVPVRIGTKNYVLREADGDVACKYRNASTRCAKMNDGKVSGVDGIADVEPLLVSLCLFEVVEANGVITGKRPVNVSVVRSWKAKIIKDLFEKAKEISHLDEDDDEGGLVRQIERLNERLARVRENRNPTGTTTAGLS